VKIYSTRRAEEGLETAQRIVVRDLAHSKERMVGEFLGQLRSNPEKTLVLVVRERGLLTGFLWAVAPEGVPYVFVWYVYGRGKTVAELLRLLGSWSRGLGRTAIRSETVGRTRAWERRWSAKPVATVMELQLSDLSSVVLKRR